MTLRQLAGRSVQDTSIFADDLIVLRRVDTGKIDPATLEIIGDTDLIPHLSEKSMPWFKQGFVANDHPRDSFVGQELVDATLGFGVARSDTGQVLKEFDGPGALIRAESAARGARISLSVEIDMDDEDADDEVEPQPDPQPFDQDE